MQETARIARKLSALAELGLERVDVAPVVTEAIRVGRKTHKVTSSVPAMGTLVSVTALAASRDRAEEALGRAFEEMWRLIGIFSRFEGASAVSHLNAEGSIVGAPPEFSHVVQRSLQYFDLSRGAFDISVEPLVDLFRTSSAGGVAGNPSHAQIEDALGLVGSDDIEISRLSIAFRREGMKITLDGIAKGYIVDAIAEVLFRHRIKSFLINAGGDIRTSGKKEGKRPWTIAVQDPYRSGDFPDIVRMSDGAVATSGSYEIYFDRKRILHHIVNSRTGASPDLNTSVSVQAPSAKAADALATAVFVMNPEEGVGFIDKLPRCACLIVDGSGRHLKSTRWKSAIDSHAEKAVRS